MHFTRKEINQIAAGKKTLTIRRRNKNGVPPANNGSSLYIKNGRTPTRYGVIEIYKVIEKPLKDMTNQEANLGGYSSRTSYINDQKKFNNLTPQDVALFYFFEVQQVNPEALHQLQ